MGALQVVPFQEDPGLVWIGVVAEDAPAPRAVGATGRRLVGEDLPPGVEIGHLMADEQGGHAHLPRVVRLAASRGSARQYARQRERSIRTGTRPSTSFGIG